MLFHSPVFLLLFLPVFLTVYWTLIRQSRVRGATSWLVACSLLFYAWADPSFLLVFLGTLGLNWLLVQINLRPARFSGSRRLVATVGVALNLGLIGWFKYSGFLAETVNALADLGLAELQFALPLGISFFSFELIALQVDVYRGKVQRLSFRELCLFVAFFPQLIAGPIVHQDDLLPQFRNGRRIRLSRTKCLLAVFLVSVGLFKKLVLASELAELFQQCVSRMDAGVLLGLVDAWVCMSAEAFYIYFDYSAYADMAMGLALLFGVRLPWSFTSPYKATSISGFWRRWNITLMRFLRNYLYIPLGGSRHGRTRQTLAILGTMGLCGLWHGAGWNFVVWGALVGAFLSVETWLGANRAPASRWQFRCLQQALVFCAYVMPLAIFVFDDWSVGFDVFASMLGFHGVGAVSHLGLMTWHLPILAAAFFIVYGLPNTYQLTARFNTGRIVGFEALEGTERSTLRFRPNLQWATVTAGLLVASVLAMGTVEEFFYFRF